MRIGVKYCGGCNPRYDRTGFVAQLKKELGSESMEWVSASMTKGPLDFVLVVCGCTAACAEHRSLEGAQGKLVVHAQEQFVIALEQLKQLRQVP